MQLWWQKAGSMRVWPDCNLPKTAPFNLTPSKAPPKSLRNFSKLTILWETPKKVAHFGTMGENDELCDKGRSGRCRK